MWAVYWLNAFYGFFVWARLNQRDNAANE